VPGIAGVVVDTSERLSDDLAARMVERLAGPGERVESATRRGAALAHAAHAVACEQGGLAADAGLLVVVSGWIAGLGRDADAGSRHHLQRHDGGGGGAAGEAPGGEAPGGTASGRGDRLARACLERYRQQGPGGLADLNGIYAAALWDGPRRRLVLAQDRLGAAGLCYHVGAGRLAFATGARALVGQVPAALDGRALGHLLSVGYPLGDRTLFRDVRALGPAALGLWENGRLIVRRAWTPPAVPAHGTGDIDEAVERFAAALDQAVGDAIGDAGQGLRVSLPLSGGLDSRTLLGHLRTHPATSTLSYGHGHSWDQRFGARAARVAGVRHRLIELPRDYMARYGPRLVHLTEGRASIHAAHVLCLVPRLARQPGIVLSGFLGDALTGAHLEWLDGLPGAGEAGAGAGGGAGARLPAVAAAGDRAAASARALFERRYRVAFDAAGLDRILRRPYAREACDAALDDFIAVHAQGEDPVTAADRVDLELRQGRYIAYQLSALGAAAPVRAPFADHRVMDECLAWPRAWRERQRLYRRYLITRQPGLARVPVTADGLPLAGPAPWMALRRLKRHLTWRWLPRLSGGLWRPHDYRQYAHYDTWIRTGARTFFTELLDDRALLDEVFDTEHVSDLLKAHLEGRIDAYQQLCAVATVGLWLRLFGRDAAHPDGMPPGQMAVPTDSGR
jgi:asparagine synthase (glutamine-hydrolysing)